MSEDVHCNGTCDGCSACGGEEPEFDGKVTLIDEEGNEVEFEVLDAVLLNDNEYIIVAPSESLTEEADIEVVVLKVETEGDEESYVTVTDEKEFEEVFEEFKKQNAEDLNFEEEK